MRSFLDRGLPYAILAGWCGLVAIVALGGIVWSLAAYEVPADCEAIGVCPGGWLLALFIFFIAILAIIPIAMTGVVVALLELAGHGLMWVRVLLAAIGPIAVVGGYHVITGGSPIDWIL